MNKLVCWLMCLIIIVLFIQLLRPSLKNNIESFQDKVLTKGCDSRIDNNGKFIGWNGETSIGDLAFKLCTSLKSIKIPNSVTSIGEEAFAGTNLKSITFEENPNLTTIGYLAFAGNSWLKSIKIPNSVTRIGNNAFYQCRNLKSITLPTNEEFTTIGKKAFYECNILESIKIPNSVTRIGNNAFYQCRNLKSITFEENSQLETIGEWAFGYCKKLTSITIPNTVKRISSYAFYECEKLESITFEENPNLTTIGGWTFWNCKKLKTIKIPKSVTNIGTYVFYGRDFLSLESIELPAELEHKFDSIKPETPRLKEWHKIERGDRILYILKCKKEGYYGDDCNRCCLLEHKADKDESSHCPTNYNVIETQDECAQASKALNPNALDPQKKAKWAWDLMRFKNWSKYCAMKDNKVFYGGAETLAEKSKNNYKRGFNYICKKD